MAWAYLVAAGLFEIGWPLGLKKGYGPDGVQVWWIVFAIVTMTASGALLMLAQRSIPMGTAYAVWTGIGAAGTAALGIWVFNDPATFFRIFGIVLIISGVIVLNLTGSH